MANADGMKSKSKKVRFVDVSTASKSFQHLKYKNGPMSQRIAPGDLDELLFGACGIGWWYALRLKRRNLKADKASVPNPLSAPSQIFRGNYKPNSESKPRSR